MNFEIYIEAVLVVCNASKRSFLKMGEKGCMIMQHSIYAACGVNEIEHENFKLIRKITKSLSFSSTSKKKMHCNPDNYS